MPGPTQTFLEGLSPTTTLPDLIEKLMAQPWFITAGLLAVLGPIAMAAMAPIQTFLTQEGYSVDPNVELTPPVLADLVVRGMITMADATARAARYGINAERFQLMVNDTGDSPALQQLADMFHRGLIPLDGAGADAVTVEQGILEGRVRDKWVDAIKGIMTIWPTIGQTVIAAIRNQLSMADAQALYAKIGGEPQFFQLLYDISGNPPSALDAARLARRGLIPKEGTGPSVTSFRQAVAEGDTKDKWGDALWALSEYFPPPRTIVALVRAGTITDQQALQYMEMAGASPQLAAAYIHEGHTPRTATAKVLAESIVHALYTDLLIDLATATTMLEALGFDAQDAGFILAVWDMELHAKALTSAIAKLRALFISRHISVNEATAELAKLELPAKQATDLIGIWTMEQRASIKLPTEAQVAAAVKKTILTSDQGLQLLYDMGYTEFGAWLVLSEQLGEKLPNPPAIPAPLSAAAAAGGA